MCACVLYTIFYISPPDCLRPSWPACSPSSGASHSGRRGGTWGSGRWQFPPFPRWGWQAVLLDIFFFSSVMVLVPLFRNHVFLTSLHIDQTKTLWCPYPACCQLLAFWVETLLKMISLLAIHRLPKLIFPPTSRDLVTSISVLAWISGAHFL